ncbi:MULTISPECIES: nitrate reductase molybdenum cofactor assembly chaperone [Arthrobacter]|uniref:Nitrate reductase molybdenum cofactor assembly chaperone n=1 Tax=Arthrobacter psychrochitiniphilus TaxID=291045 RepID=A0A2V3DW71_9MICC|nr:MULTISPECIES: nitrate reductase molybdenum cofactor assembly chaperone [Arthrobacter]NYG15635.1 nitrate reductase delta subunit [Arthrobacter psychrochitiniphilus]PXA66881.1 nitrate reductase molybdenum cofactor assembly chaperone [Arthrobacter psychrochitiniphilus]
MSRKDQVTFLAAAWCLSYPDELLLERVPLMRAALGEFPGALAPFAVVLDSFQDNDLMALQSQYVAEFDLGKRHALHLSYWTDGDTRRRGEVLGAFKKVYRGSDTLVNTRGELPDFLPMVLEFAATVDMATGKELLQQYRPSLELIKFGLLRDDLAHTEIVQAVCNTLPGASPADEQAVMRMAGFGPPTESVGLDPYDPRLLPMKGA